MSYSRTACSSGEAYYADNCVAFGDRSDPKYDLYFNFRRDFQTIYDDRDSDNWYSFIKGKDPTTFSDGDSEDPGHSDTFGFIFNGSSYLTADFASAIVIDVPITIGLWIQF